MTARFCHNAEGGKGGGRGGGREGRDAGGGGGASGVVASGDLPEHGAHAVAVRARLAGDDDV